MDALHRFKRAADSVLALAAGSVLVFMLAVVTLNMAGRPFGMPIQGSFDVMGYGTGLLVALGLGKSQLKRVHICVDILFRRFPEAMQRWMGSAADLAAALFFATVAWKLAGLGLDRMESGEALQNIQWLVEYPFVFLVALGFALFAFNLLVDAVDEALGRREGA